MVYFYSISIAKFCTKYTDECLISQQKTAATMTNSQDKNQTITP
ncbi:hypothetical protein BN1221_01585c [Brenneria goodwinii]|uniref:Uncharacterized protein n=1 Tax=Brenneria goodwinii TaxID=1109412 RepID=A0A0G4JTA4_9GAMM|nr:hypothetical protein BN1221_01585c [Brenneria goodwinii]